MLNQDDRGKGSLVAQIKSAAERYGVELPDGWKPEVARRIVVAWSTTDPADMPSEILDRSEALFKELTERFRWNRAVGVRVNVMPACACLGAQLR